MRWLAAGLRDLRASPGIGVFYGVCFWAAVGGVFAWLVYSTCVISIPMILDRDTDAASWGLGSVTQAGTRTAAATAGAESAIYTGGHAGPATL